ncbi:MAG: T9SS type A sorting domain-containing protein [Bacteroidota bacterium]
MRPFFQSFFFITLFAQALSAQNGCPGCLVSVPANLPADTIYLPALPDGQQGVAYNKDYSFRLPKTTTPFAAIDSTTPAGLTISKIDIISISGLPQGLDWTPNQWSFDPSTQTDGCMKLCGTPQESDTFLLMVKVKVTVFIITREVEFPLHLYIAPKISSTNGFSMTNFTGCGHATTSFVNKVPSGGHNGFTYHWDFGDGTTFNGENPPPHPYNSPGAYIVKYRAMIDTVGYILQSATVIDVECVDELGAGHPDLYLLLKNPGGTQIYDSSPDINNAPLPYTFPLNIKLGQGNYNLAVWDEDSGLKGSDDPCGNVSFNILSDGTITSGGFVVALKIIHPIDSVLSTDTIRVYPQPTQPIITAPFGLSKCAGSPNQIRLNTNAPVSRQWWLNGAEIVGAIDTFLIPTQSGYYKVQTITPDGCEAVSDSAFVEIYPQPASPLYMNHNNLLSLVNTTNLPAQYELQWYFGVNAIAGANGFTHCATADGIYGLLVKDLSNQCSSYYSATVDYNPNFDCTISATTPANAAMLNMYPNPAKQSVTLYFAQALTSEAMLQLWDMTGRQYRVIPITSGTVQYTLDCSTIPSGMYNLTVQSADGTSRQGKLTIIK